MQINSIYFKKNMNLIHKADKARGNQFDSKMIDIGKAKIKDGEIAGAEAYGDEDTHRSRNLSQN